MEFIPEEDGRQERVKTSQLKWRVGESRTNRREACVGPQYVTLRPLIVGKDSTWVNKWLSSPPALHISDNVNASQQQEGETAHTHHVGQRPGKTERQQQQQHLGVTKTVAQCKPGCKNTISQSSSADKSRPGISSQSNKLRDTLLGWSTASAADLWHVPRGDVPARHVLSAPKCNYV